MLLALAGLAAWPVGATVPGHSHIGAPFAMPSRRGPHPHRRTIAATGQPRLSAGHIVALGAAERRASQSLTLLVHQTRLDRLNVRSAIPTA